MKNKGKKKRNFQLNKNTELFCCQDHNCAPTLAALGEGAQLRLRPQWCAIDPADPHPTATGPAEASTLWTLPPQDCAPTAAAEAELSRLQCLAWCTPKPRAQLAAHIPLQQRRLSTYAHSPWDTARQTTPARGTLCPTPPPGCSSRGGAYLHSKWQPQ